MKMKDFALLLSIQNKKLKKSKLWMKMISKETKLK